jgi:hypothetical protein
MKNHNLATICFFLFVYFICFWLYTEISKPFCFHPADRGASHPTKMSELWCRGDAQVVVEHEVIEGGIREVERNLWGLTMGVPPTRRQYVPLHFQ